MKRVIVLLLALIMVLSLAACGKDEPSISENIKKTVSAETPEPAPEPVAERQQAAAKMPEELAMELEFSLADDIGVSLEPHSSLCLPAPLGDTRLDLLVKHEISREVIEVDG